jgi:hypothetical protein
MERDLLPPRSSILLENGPQSKIATVVAGEDKREDP